jgi:flagella basal body P-ring formation protein FlgA
MASGTVLSRDLVTLPPVIERGRIVRLLYQRPGLRIVTRAKALEDGLLGEAIRVRPLDAKRSCQAVVRGEEEVEVIAP